MPNEALQRACNEVGGQKSLAERISTSQSQVWYWLVKAKRGAPAEYCEAIEKATGGKISRHELRPDIYPAPLPEQERCA